MYDFLLVRHCNYSSILYHFRVIWSWIYRDLEIWLRGHSRSLKLVPFVSLSAVSYSPSIVTMAVSIAICVLFSVKACDLGKWVRGRSRSLKMAPNDRPYATFYWSAIITIALSCTIFEFFDIEEYRDLEIWLTGHSRLLKLVPFKSLGWVSSHSPSTVTNYGHICSRLWDI